mmetsp:Transcript_22628/g.59140  ORF Transcript_22628/g.59140 Transcript_22628/m.59140 type:complete len:121 (+) Transcript_22628:563-925(+)
MGSLYFGSFSSFFLGLLECSCAVRLGVDTCDLSDDARFHRLLFRSLRGESDAARRPSLPGDGARSPVRSRTPLPFLASKLFARHIGRLYPAKVGSMESNALQYSWTPWCATNRVAAFTLV